MIHRGQGHDKLRRISHAGKAVVLLQKIHEVFLIEFDAALALPLLDDEKDISVISSDIAVRENILQLRDHVIPGNRAAAACLVEGDDHEVKIAVGDELHLFHALIQFILVNDPTLHDVGHETSQFRVAGVIHALSAEKVLRNGVSKYCHIV